MVHGSGIDCKMGDWVQSKLPCPLPGCNSSDAYHIHKDGHGFCFSCNRPTFVNQGINDLSFTYEYLPWRGVSAEAFRKYGAITRISSSGEPISIGFPYPTGGTKIRYLDRKEFYWEGTHKPGLFGMDRFSPGAHRYVTITEGELDAITLSECLSTGSGGSGVLFSNSPQAQLETVPVVSVQSASSARADCLSARSWLDQYERIYICLDQDTAGSDAAAAVARLFDPRKVFLVKLGRFKDPNEFVQHGCSDELRKIWWQAKKYLPTTIISSFEDFRAELSKPKAPSIPFPWKSWNDALYGIRKGESYLITALEGVGKTEVMHAIEHQLLKETDDNVAAIFLEEPKDRHLRAMAGLQLKCPAHLPHANVNDSEAASAVEEVVRRTDRLFIYSHFGTDDPEVLLDTIRYLVAGHQCGYVLLDHVGMVISGTAGEKERTTLDYIITQLEMMCVELNFALIFVSHVNDEGLTRGSRMISKIANNRIDLFRDIISSDEKIKNTVSVRVSKNRWGGKTGPINNLEFDQTTWSFNEKENETPKSNPKTNIQCESPSL